MNKNKLTSRLYKLSEAKDVPFNILSPLIARELILFKKAIPFKINHT